MRGTRKDYGTPGREEVEALVEKFLDGNVRESVRSGFAEVSEGDVEELDALILALVKYRYKPDPDGDRPIRWSLCDWSRLQPHNYVYLPHSDENGNQDEQRLDLALLNLDIAMSEVRSTRAALRYSREKK